MSSRHGPTTPALHLYEGHPPWGIMQQAPACGLDDVDYTRLTGVVNPCWCQAVWTRVMVSPRRPAKLLPSGNIRRSGSILVVV